MVPSSQLGPGKHLALQVYHLDANQLLVQVGDVGRALPGQGAVHELVRGTFSGSLVSAWPWKSDSQEH